jgi:hypothetical protein
MFQIDLQMATSRQTPCPDPFSKGKPGLKETLFQMDLQEATSHQTPAPTPLSKETLDNRKPCFR